MFNSRSLSLMYKKLLIVFGIVCIITPWLNIGGLNVSYPALFAVGFVSLCTAAVMNHLEKR